MNIDGKPGNYMVFLKLLYGPDDLERGYHFIYCDQEDFAAVSDAVQKIVMEKRQENGDFYLLGIPEMADNPAKEKWKFNYLLAIDQMRVKSNIFTIQRNTKYTSDSPDYAAELAKVKNRDEIIKGKRGLCDILKCDNKQKQLPFPYNAD